MDRGTTGVNSLPKTATRQRDCDLNPGPTAPESSTLTTRLPVQYCSYLCVVCIKHRTNLIIWAHNPRLILQTASSIIYLHWLSQEVQSTNSRPSAVQWSSHLHHKPELHAQPTAEINKTANGTLTSCGRRNRLHHVCTSDAHTGNFYKTFILMIPLLVNNQQMTNANVEKRKRKKRTPKTQIIHWRKQLQKWNITASEDWIILAD